MTRFGWRNALRDDGGQFNVGWANRAAEIGT
jgi:hypothetical protein